MKITVLYYSKTGTTKEMGEKIAEGIKSVEGAEVKVFSLDEVDESWIMESKAVIMGTPVYMADMCGAMKMWFETTGKKYKLAGKIGGAFATADYIHGGGDISVQNILKNMMVYGMLTYSGGGSYGKPVIHLGPVAIKGVQEESYETFNIYGERFAQKVLEIFG